MPNIGPGSSPAPSARHDQGDKRVDNELLPPDANAAFDADAAAAFLSSQAAWLQHGLDRADDPTEVGIVLGTHDATHEQWLQLIGDVERHVGDEAAAEVSLLYGFHGRVVGSLERGSDLRLEPAVVAQIRRMLSERLASLTGAAVAAVRGEVSGRVLHAVRS